MAFALSSVAQPCGWQAPAFAHPALTHRGWASRGFQRRGWEGAPCSPEGDQFQEQRPHFLSATSSRFWKLLSSSPAILAIRSPVGSL